MSAAKKKKESAGNRQRDSRKMKTGKKESPSADKVYDITGDGDTSFQAAIEELEEHASELEERKRQEKKQGKAPSGPAARETVELVEYEALKEEYEALSGEMAALKDKWLRSVAEFENYRKRSRKEWELLKMQSKADVILEILNVMDDFERAFAAAEDRDDEFVQGIRLIYNKMQQSLHKLGVQPIDALHTRFDPSFHMAIGQIDSDSVESGHVAEETQKGYLMGETVLRPAKVIIAK